MDLPAKAVPSTPMTGPPSASCCFNLISRWFKRRKQSIDINSNCSTGAGCKNKDFCYQNLTDPAFARLKSKSLVTDSESLITAVLTPADCDAVAAASAGRRTSILVLEPKVKSSIQYYKKRVSFADIMIRNEYQAEEQLDLHHEESEEDEDEGEEEGQDDHDRSDDRREGDQGLGDHASAPHPSSGDRVTDEGRESNHKSKNKKKKKPAPPTTTTTTPSRKKRSGDAEREEEDGVPDPAGMRQRRLQREYGRADQISAALVS